MTRRHRKSAPLPYVALLLACAVPGAGHAYLGRLKRGIIIFVTITALFWSGVAVGGVLTVDCYLERWWFVAEMFAGVHGLIGWYRQREEYADRLRDVDVPGKDIETKIADMQKQGLLDARMAQADWTRHGTKKELGEVALVVPAETVARAYAGVAGLLNLMCIFDALMLSIMGVRGEPAPDGPSPPKMKVKPT